MRVSLYGIELQIIRAYISSKENERNNFKLNNNKRLKVLRNAYNSAISKKRKGSFGGQK